jgi:DNA-binding GntR family transcriptional regulator
MYGAYFGLMQNNLPSTIIFMKTTISMYSDLGTKVYDILKSMIVKGELKPGQKLIQEGLAEALGVSRTPLLQAISKLSKDHYIYTIPRRGSFVKEFTQQEYLDIFDIRGQLEPMGAYYAAEKITEKQIQELQTLLEETSRFVQKEEFSNVLDMFSFDYNFHMQIMRLSGNNFLYDIMKNLNNVLCNSERILKTPKKTLEEHLEIFNALKNHDANGAKELMFHHIHGGARSRLVQLLANQDAALKENKPHA